MTSPPYRRASSTPNPLFPEAFVPTTVISRGLFTMCIAPMFQWIFRFQSHSNSVLRGAGGRCLPWQSTPSARVKGARWLLPRSPHVNPERGQPLAQSRLSGSQAHRQRAVTLSRPPLSNACCTSVSTASAGSRAGASRGGWHRPPPYRSGHRYTAGNGRRGKPPAAG